MRPSLWQRLRAWVHRECGRSTEELEGEIARLEDELRFALDDLEAERQRYTELAARRLSEK